MLFIPAVSIWRCISILMLVISYASPSLAWNSLPVGESASLSENGSEYHVEIKCSRNEGGNLYLRIDRFIPPHDEIERIKSVTLNIHKGTTVNLSREVAVAFFSERDVYLIGRLNMSKDDVDLIGSGTKLELIDSVSGKVIFSEPMNGTLQGRMLFHERCGI